LPEEGEGNTVTICFVIDARREKKKKEIGSEGKGEEKLVSNISREGEESATSRLAKKVAFRKNMEKGRRRGRPADLRFIT